MPSSKRNSPSRVARNLRRAQQHAERPTTDAPQCKASCCSPPPQGDAPDSSPGALSSDIGDAMQLAQLEAATTLPVVLRHLVRTLHRNGSRICFPVPEACDRIVLRSHGLPAAPDELLLLVQRSFLRRQQPLDLDAVYADLVLAHGRVSTDFRKPWPECYFISRLP